MLEAAFRGFAQLDAPAAAEWWNTLGVDAHSSTETVRTAYMRLRAQHHPDKPSGAADAFDAVQKAWSAFCAQRGITP